MAAILTEPALTNIGIVLPEPGFLARLLELATRYGALLMIDETHTISAGSGGMTARDGLRPDVFVIGKAIGGGIPSGAYGLSDEVVDAVHRSTASGAAAADRRPLIRSRPPPYNALAPVHRLGRSGVTTGRSVCPQGKVRAGYHPSDFDR